jgi:hypothetical protein
MSTYSNVFGDYNEGSSSYLYSNTTTPTNTSKSVSVGKGTPSSTSTVRFESDNINHNHSHNHSHSHSQATISITDQLNQQIEINNQLLQKYKTLQISNQNDIKNKNIVGVEMTVLCCVYRLIE